jgi:hypothetical protein
MVSKNGFEFKLEDIEAELDEERSRERTEETDIKTAVVEFHVNVVQIEDEERFNYELKGNIEYDADGAEPEFDDGSQYRSYLTLLAGDILDAEFNRAIKDFFAEDCDFNNLIYDELDEETTTKIDEMIN